MNFHPKAMMEVEKVKGYETIKQALSDCRQTTSHHPHLIKKLRALYAEIGLEEFAKSFFFFIRIPMLKQDKHPAIDRIWEFVAKLATSLKTKEEEEKAEEEKNDESDEDDVDLMNPFLEKLLRFLIYYSKSQHPVMRVHSCEIIAAIMNHMPQSASIDDELFEDLSNAMLNRMSDKQAAVRAKAVFAVQRLQTPQNPTCPVIQAYLYHLNNDPSQEVRLNILKTIVSSVNTLQSVIQHTRDVKDIVRRRAFVYLAKKVHIKSLSISSRERLFREGLKDSVESVRKSVEMCLIPVWLQLCDENIVTFLQYLDVISHTDTSVLVLRAIFKKVPSDELIKKFDLLGPNKLIPEDQLNPERVLYWRSLCEFIKECNGEDALEQLLPELTPFCTYLQSIFVHVLTEEEDEKQDQNEFVIEQLLLLAKVFDMSDEVGRKQLEKFIRKQLVSTSLPNKLVGNLVSCMDVVIPQANIRLQELAELVAEIREPMTQIPEMESEQDIRRRKLQKAELSVQALSLRDELEEAVSQHNYLRAQELKQQMEKLQQQQKELDEASVPRLVEVKSVCKDSKTIIKCLKIVCAMLGGSKVETINATICSLKDNFIMDCVQNENLDIRYLSFKALGLCCYLKRDVAKQHFILFDQSLKIDEEEIQLLSLKVVGDLLTVFGLDAFDLTYSDDIFDDAGCSVVSGKTNTILFMKKLLSSDSLKIRSCAAEILARLFLTSRISSRRLLSHLLIMWYDPENETNKRLLSLLGTFFTIFATRSYENQKILMEICRPTVEIIYNAPATSSLPSIDLQNVSKFFTQLTSSNLCKENLDQLPCLHTELALIALREVLKNPDQQLNSMWIKMLSSLYLTTSDLSVLEELLDLVKQVQEEISEGILLRKLEQFHQNVAGLMPQPSSPSITTCIVTPARQPKRMSSKSVQSTAKKSLARKRKTQLSNHAETAEPRCEEQDPSSTEHIEEFTSEENNSTDAVDEDEEKPPKQPAITVGEFSDELNSLEEELSNDKSFDVDKTVVLGDSDNSCIEIEVKQEVCVKEEEIDDEMSSVKESSTDLENTIVIEDSDEDFQEETYVKKEVVEEMEEEQGAQVMEDEDTIMSTPPRTSRRARSSRSLKLSRVRF